MFEVRVTKDTLGEGAESGSIILWMYPEGARVQRGDVIAEFLVDKITLEIQAPAAGVLRIKVPAEIAVADGALLALIESY